MYRKFLQLALVALALGLFQSAGAVDYWVVGSFAKQSDAESEARRVGRLVGIDISIEATEANGTIRYRLLTEHPSVPAERENLVRVLKSVGVKEPWRISRSAPVEPAMPEMGEETGTAGMGEETGTAGMGETPPASDMTEATGTGMDETLEALATPPPVPDNPVFLVVGNFQDFEAAIDLERKLEQKFTGVSSRSTFTDGRLYHRVLLGPIAEADLMSVKASLEQEGVTEVSEISPEEAGYTDTDRVDVTGRQSPRERRDAEAAEAAGPEVEGYNPAKLNLPSKRF